MDGWQEWDTPAKRLKGARKARGLTQEQLSESSGVKQSDVSKLERGDSLSTSKWPQLARALGVDPFWLAQGEGLPQLGPEDRLVSIRPPTVSQAVHALSELLLNMDPAKRGMAESALTTLVRDPAQVDTVSEVLSMLTKEMAPPPSPAPAPGPAADPPAGAKKTKASKSQAAAKATLGRANLVLKIGGGQRRQLTLPLTTVADPFDRTQAPPRELAWYEQLKVAPKAAND